MPQQDPLGNDGGVFALMCADRVALDAPLDLSAEDAPDLRLAVAAAVLGFLGEDA
jgi:Ulp1 family protease